MVHWGWLIAAWVIGEIMGMMVVIICIGGGRKEQKKTADAATSTADRETVRKDYFL